VPGAGGPDAAADPEQWGRPVGAGEHDQAQVRRSLSASALASPGGAGLGLVCPEETAQPSTTASACALWSIISKRLTQFDLLTRN